MNANKPGLIGCRLLRTCGALIRLLETRGHDWDAISRLVGQHERRRGDAEYLWGFAAGYMEARSDLARIAGEVAASEAQFARERGEPLFTLIR